MGIGSTRPTKAPPPRQIRAQFRGPQAPAEEVRSAPALPVPSSGPVEVAEKRRYLIAGLRAAVEPGVHARAMWSNAIDRPAGAPRVPQLERQAMNAPSICDATALEPLGNQVLCRNKGDSEPPTLLDIGQTSLSPAGRCKKGTVFIPSQHQAFLWRIGADAQVTRATQPFTWQELMRQSGRDDLAPRGSKQYTMKLGASFGDDLHLACVQSDSARAICLVEHHGSKHQLVDDVRVIERGRLDMSHGPQLFLRTVPLGKDRVLLWSRLSSFFDVVSLKHDRLEVARVSLPADAHGANAVALTNRGDVLVAYAVGHPKHAVARYTPSTSAGLELVGEPCHFTAGGFGTDEPHLAVDAEGRIAWSHPSGLHLLHLSPRGVEASGVYILPPRIGSQTTFAGAPFFGVSGSLFQGATVGGFTDRVQAYAPHDLSVRGAPFEEGPTLVGLGANPCTYAVRFSPVTGRRLARIVER